MEEKLILSIGTLGFIFILFAIIYIITCHIVVINTFFFNKKYPTKIVVISVLNTLPTILLYLLIRFLITKNPKTLN